MGHWESTVVTTDRGTFECFISGKGKPLCTAHLYQEFTSVGNPFADVLADYYQVIAVNLKCAGKSSKPHNKLQLSMNESLIDLESIRNFLGYDKWSYAGHSTGGFLGLKYSTSIPESIESLIVSGTAPSKDFQKSKECIYNFHDGNHRLEMRKIWLSMMSPFISRRRKDLARRRLIEMSLFKPEKYDQYYTNKPESASRIIRKRMRAYVQDLKTYDVRDRLKDIDIPTLILCGAHDVQCPPENSYEIASLITTAQLVIFDESNHFPFIEQPLDYRKAIQSFAQNN